MKKILRLMSILGLLFPFSLSADEYPWLTFKMADNTEVSVAAENLSINYNAATLHLKSATVDESFAIAQIKSMRFSSTPAAITEVTDIQPEAADYYTAAGVKAGRFESIEEARRELPSGIYFGKSSTKTFKVIF